MDKFEANIPEKVEISEPQQIILQGKVFEVGKIIYMQQVSSDKYLKGKLVLNSKKNPYIGFEDGTRFRLDRTSQNILSEKEYLGLNEWKEFDGNKFKQGDIVWMQQVSNPTSYIQGEIFINKSGVPYIKFEDGVALRVDQTSQNILSNAEYIDFFKAKVEPYGGEYQEEQPLTPFESEKLSTKEGLASMDVEFEKPFEMQVDGVGKITAATNKGVARSENQDAVVIKNTQDDKGQYIIGAVIDGMGGEHGGKLAAMALGRAINEAPINEHSRITLDKAREHMRDLGVTGNGGACYLKFLLGADGNLRYEAMGNVALFVVHEDGSYDQTTRVEEIPNSKYVTNALRANEPSRLENVGEMHLSPGDKVVVASDGLFHNLSLQEITQIVMAGGDENAVMSKLKQTCFEKMQSTNGKPDNLSVAIVEYNPSSS